MAFEDDVTAIPLYRSTACGKLFSADWGTPGEDCGSISTEPIGFLREEMFEVFSDSGEKKSGRDFKDRRLMLQLGVMTNVSC